MKEEIKDESIAIKRLKRSLDLYVIKIMDNKGVNLPFVCNAHEIDYNITYYGLMNSVCFETRIKNINNLLTILNYKHRIELINGVLMEVHQSKINNKWQH